MRALALALAPIVVAACGQTSHDSAGTGGAGGSSGAGGAPTFDCVGEHWKRLAPPPGSTLRSRHGAVAWHDHEVLVWGGQSTKPGLMLGTGWRVRADGTVSPLPAAGAPSPRGAHAFDVLGDRLLVWGGNGPPTGHLGDGAWLDLVTDQWSPLPSTTELLGPRHSHAFGVVGHRWLVWGGLSDGVPQANGAVWDPATDSWSATPDAPVETWTSVASLAQGGPEVGPVVLGVTKYDTRYGYGYDAGSDQWWTMASEGAPSARSQANLTWSRASKELLVWGGFPTSGTMLNDGARYSLAGTWTPMSTENAPGPRAGHYAAMVGSKLVVFGGSTGEVLDSATGGIYDVTSDTWAPLPLGDCAPPPRSSATFTAFGNGTQALLWGGVSPGDELPGEYGWLFTL